MKCVWRYLLVVAALVAGCLLLTTCGDEEKEKEQTPVATSTTAVTETPAAADTPYASYESKVYSDVTNWLCRPDTDDVCDENLDATVVRADGSVEVQPFEPAEDAPIDCFYLYPTVSVDPGTNSDLVPDPDFEGMVARNQAARLASQCRLYAPMYRQITLTALVESLVSGESPFESEPSDIAYESVLDAWKHYIANDNDGRGVVLVGHSQGSGMLSRLIQEEIDGDEQLRGRLVSALLLGWPVAVPEGEDVGGDFANIPLCREAAQTGCVISYSSFSDTAPPPQDTVFGRVDEGVAACTNPASLGGGRGTLRPYFESDRGGGPFNQFAMVRTVEEPWAVGAQITTPWVVLPDFVEAECVIRDGFSYLEITVLADPADQRTDDIGGDTALPSFGLHIVDANLAMGDLVEIVSQQAEAYTAGGN
jgi:hypothetical protein